MKGVGSGVSIIEIYDVREGAEEVMDWIPKMSNAFHFLQTTQNDLPTINMTFLGLLRLSGGASSGVIFKDDEPPGFCENNGEGVNPSTVAIIVNAKTAKNAAAFQSNFMVQSTILCLK